MGNGTSHLRDLAANEALRRMVSPEPLPPEHPFWNGMLSFKVKAPGTKSEWKALEESVEESLKRFVGNNLKSGNYGSLIRVFLGRQAELASSLESDSSLFVWQTFNALLLLRVCTKYFVERLKEEDCFRQFCAVPSKQAEPVANGESQEAVGGLADDPGQRLEAFVAALISTVSDLPTTPLTYGIQCECVHTLLILLSTPVFSVLQPAAQLRSFRAVMGTDPASANSLTSALMRSFADQAVAPASYLSEEGGSLVLGIASGMWNILTLGYGNQPPASNENGGENVEVSTKPLADASLLLLLVLTNHCTDGPNPYRDALFNCSNVTSKDSSAGANINNVGENSSISEAVPSVSFHTDFGRLFKTLCATLSADGSTLLLYLLLHRNSDFRTHVLASSDVERVVLPILRTLYRAPESSNHHIYMSLIVLLILSEDDLFNTSVHDISMKGGVDWYTERQLHEISLGGLLILVVIRTIQYNMLKMRDKYLHTNCLAALANMSGQFKNLHPYVSQRIVSMFEALARKHSRLVNTLQQAGAANGGDVDGNGFDGHEDSPLSEAVADVSALEEVLRMILEIVNSCLASQIKSNSNLIYTLLYKKEVFEPFMTQPAFHDLSQNLQTVIAYFNSRLEQAQERKERPLAVNEVQDIIRQTAMQFPREKLTKFPDLKFKYVEEEQPEDFFVPYVWTLVGSRIYWNPAYVKLLS